MSTVNFSEQNFNWNVQQPQTGGTKKLYCNGKECVIVKADGKKTRLRERDVEAIAKRLVGSDAAPEAGKKLIVNLDDGRTFAISYKDEGKTNWSDTEARLKDLPKALKDVKNLNKTDDSQTVRNRLQLQLINLKSARSVSSDKVNVETEHGPKKMRRSDKSETAELTRKIWGTRIQLAANTMINAGRTVQGAIKGAKSGINKLLEQRRGLSLYFKTKKNTEYLNANAIREAKSNLGENECLLTHYHEGSTYCNVIVTKKDVRRIEVGTAKYSFETSRWRDWDDDKKEYTSFYDVIRDLFPGQNVEDITFVKCDERGILIE